MDTIKKLIEQAKKDSTPFTYEGSSAYMVNDLLAIVPETQQFISKLTKPFSDGEKEWCVVTLQESKLDELLHPFGGKETEGFSEANNHQCLYNALLEANRLGIITEPHSEGIFVFENGLAYDYPINKWVKGNKHFGAHLTTTEMDVLANSITQLINHKRCMTNLMDEAIQHEEGEDTLTRVLICHGDTKKHWNKDLFKLVMEDAGCSDDQRKHFFNELSGIPAHVANTGLAQRISKLLLPADAYARLERLIAEPNWRNHVKYHNEY